MYQTSAYAKSARFGIKKDCGTMTVKARIEAAKNKGGSNLNLLGMELKEIPSEVWKMTGLTKLNLAYNQLTSLPIEIGRLVNLTSLYLSENQLTSLPVEIGKLVNLTSLYLSANQLTSLPVEIGKLVNLTSLYLSANQLTSLPVEIGKLVNLTELELGYNQLTSLPVEIGNLLNLRNLNLRGNPLEYPPIEIARKGIQAIRDYFETINVSEAEKLYEAKLLIVGAGKVGKTCLRKKLINNEYDIQSEEQSTEGVEIDHWLLPQNPLNPEKDFTAHIWDFGGQEVYHATHQFFLTKRSLYIFVWEARKEEGILNFEYWLNVIKLLSESSPVILVMNKSDERSIEIDRASLRDKFPNIIKFLEISCLKGTNIRQLTEFIADNIIKLPLVGIDWPKVWTEIRKSLESDTRNFIDHKEYLKICSQFGIVEEKAGVLSSFLHDLGIILHYQDDPILQNIAILKPEWGTTAVYRVLDTPAVKKSKGRFHYRDLHEIWKDTKYPPEKHRELLALMEKFELCFKLIDTQEYIIPELLSAERPDYEWFADDNLRFEYHYEFLPEGIITRFIVRNHQLIEKDHYWKNRVIFEWEGARARVMQEKLNRKIRIAIAGKNKKDLLAIIRKEFDHIHETLNNPDVKEMVQCNCKECVISKEPHFHEYSVLRKFIEKGEETIQCIRSAEKVPIRILLGEFITEKEYENIADRRRGIRDSYHLEQGSRLYQFRGDAQIGENIDKQVIEKNTSERKSRLNIIYWIVGILVGLTVLYVFFADRIFKSNKSPESGQIQSGKTEIKKIENMPAFADSISAKKDSTVPGR